MKYIYKSRLKEHIHGFLNQKHTLGYLYITSERVLKSFDIFCFENYSSEKNITEEIGKAWAVIRPTEKSVSFQNRLAPVRELARYINRLGIDAYVIPLKFSPKITDKHIPYIFTDEEIILFFKAADSLEINQRCTLRHIMVPIMFRLMYCCGLRPSEVRLLKTKDINFQDNVINIIESKGHKDRIVMVSSDVMQLCQNYYYYRKQICQNCDYFFPSKRNHGNYYVPSWLSTMFAYCWDMVSIPNRNGIKPRSYDFRHTFVTKRFYLWMKEEKDLNAMLPYLSAYLGHEQFSQTAYYLHLVPGLFSQINPLDINEFSSLLPEVDL